VNKDGVYQCKKHASAGELVFPLPLVSMCSALGSCWDRAGVRRASSASVGPRTRIPPFMHHAGCPAHPSVLAVPSPPSVRPSPPRLGWPSPLSSLPPFPPSPLHRPPLPLSPSRLVSPFISASHS
jgi:hypothetical protein